MIAVASIVEIVLSMAPGEADVLTPADDPSAWTRLAGRLHPAIVHFPIALILTAALLEVLGRLRPRARRDGQRVGSALVCLAIGAPAACLAAWFGWINADLETQSASLERTLFLHRWVGISVAVLACLALLLGLLGRVRSFVWGVRLYWSALLLAVPAVSLGGYLGGELVHGQGYLLEVFRGEGSGGARVAEGAASELSADPEFAAVVRPIMERRCFECHGPNKKRGNLRLDSHEAVFGGAPEDWAIKPGDAAASLVVERITLPAEHDDRMPGKGDPLTAEEIKAISDWIDRGASYAGAAPLEAAQAASGVPARPPDRLPVGAGRVEPGPVESAAVARALAALEARGAVAMPRAADSSDVDVNFSMASPPIGDDDLALLAGLESTLVWLNLARSNVTDAGIERLRPYRSLRRLHLERTSVGDAGTPSLARLSGLEYLNLYGTKVTDEGLSDLGALPNLRHLYLWQTGVTEEAAAALRARRPELTIDLGQALLPPPEPEVEGAEGEAKAEADVVAVLPPCCAEARAGGGECTHSCCVAAAAEGRVCEKCAG